MFRRWPGILAAAVLLPHLVTAQRVVEEEGFEMGSFRVRPVAEANVAYDNRVSRNPATGDTDGDVYSELAASLYLDNNPARYDLSAEAGYGYRFYNEYTDLNGDFYHAGLLVATTDSPLRVGLSSYIRKSLDYDSVFEDATGEGPAAILSGEPTTWYTTRAYVEYERYVTDKTSVVPGYELWHYFQDFEDGGDAEWQIHRASMQMGYDYTAKTRLTLTGYYSLQVNDDEDGRIGAVTAGAEGSMTDKSSWSAEIGVAAANYDNSGSDQGVVGRLDVSWIFTEKVSAYILGMSDFLPGYEGGAARRIYRLGYGVRWQVTSRWAFDARVLHDYDEELGDSATAEDEVKNFISVESEYEIARRMSLIAGIEYNMDEEEEDQAIAGLRLIYRY